MRRPGGTEVLFALLKGPKRLRELQSEVGYEDVRGAPMTKEQVGEYWRSKREGWKRRVIEELERGDYDSWVLKGIYYRLRLNDRNHGVNSL